MAMEQLALYRTCHPVIDTHYNKNGSRTPMEAIVSAIADAEGVDICDLPPLYDAVNPDALDALFCYHDGIGESQGTFSFEYDRWNVFVHGDGRIRICDGQRHGEKESIFQ